MNNMRIQFAVMVGCLIILCGRVSAQESAIVEKSSQPASVQTQCAADKDIGALEKKINSLNTALADINKKYSELESELDSLRVKLNALSVENQNAKLSAKKSQDNYNDSARQIEAQKDKIDELGTQLRLIEKTVSNLQERQSVGEYSIKKDYGHEVEKSKRSSKFMNILAISIALIAVVVAL